jgi:hypothetical protein
MEEQVMDEMEVGDAISLLRARLDALETKAADLCKQHFDFVMAENKARAWEHKSVLYAQARMRDNTLNVIWYEVHWYGSKAAKTRRMTKKLIRKPKVKHGYNLDALLKLAQPWEADRVRDIEQELLPIRREAAFIGKAIGQLNHIIKREGCFR